MKVLSDMQWNGMYVDKEELEQFGKRINIKIRNNNKKLYTKWQEKNLILIQQNN